MTKTTKKKPTVLPSDGACTCKMPRHINVRENATILAALRFWQYRNLPDNHPHKSTAWLAELEIIAREHGPSLDTEEIDMLCVRLNVGK